MAALYFSTVFYDLTFILCYTNTSKNKMREKEIKGLVNNYCESKDLFKLADALLAIKKILKDNNFPIKKYTKWLRKQKS